MKPSKRNKRNQAKYPALQKNLNLKIRQEELDQDYISKLSESEKEWLNRFNEEYVNNNFNHPGKILHKTKKLKKDCSDRNNARNRDTYSVCKTNKLLITPGEPKDKGMEERKASSSLFEKNRSTNLKETEEVLIRILDEHNKKN